nr:copper homeostasis protein CutC [uncultured Porphyromonas sp.]
MKESELIIENCAGDVPSCLEAERGGASRIELCAALSEGGTTPSYGTVATALRHCHLPIIPIIRPRSGDFLYTETEIDVMLEDIRVLRRLGVAGFSLGALTPDGDLDEELCRRLIREAEGLPVTLHRAFDRTASLEASLELAVELGFACILTSGGTPSAVDSLDRIRRLVEQADGRICIMAGSGITADNARHIVQSTGVSAIHGTFARLRGSSMRLSSTPFPDSSVAQIPERDYRVTDADAISSIRQSLLS